MPSLPLVERGQRGHTRGWPCYLCWAIEDGGGEVEDWWKDAHDLDYLERMRVTPSLMLQRVASRYPEFEWLCFLPDAERRWYLTVGNAEYVKQTFFPHVVEWAYEALAS